MTTPMVSVVIPARNEAEDLPTCVEGLLRQDYSHNRMEILVVDGGSTDETKAVAAEALSRSDVAWTIVDNPTGTTPSNLNLGMEMAAGEILCRVDARSLVSPGHVRRCVELLLADPSRAVVGGGQKAVARPHASLIAQGIARALNNRWTTGLAHYRRSTTPGPTDTVYLGAFRTRVLRSVGGWAEELPTNQDFDLNQRLQSLGLVWFDPTLTVGYLPRQRLDELARQYFRFGRWKRRYWRLRAARPSGRQQALLLLPPLLGAFAAAGVRRHPFATTLLLGAGMVVVDAQGGDATVGPAQRAAAVVASGVIASSWWVGVVWESLRG